jgi:hypothetical protein
MSIPVATVKVVWLFDNEEDAECGTNGVAECYYNDTLVARMPFDHFENSFLDGVAGFREALDITHQPVVYLEEIVIDQERFNE